MRDNVTNNSFPPHWIPRSNAISEFLSSSAGLVQQTGLCFIPLESGPAGISVSQIPDHTCLTAF